MHALQVCSLAGGQQEEAVTGLLEDLKLPLSNPVHGHVKFVSALGAAVGWADVLLPARLPAR